MSLWGLLAQGIQDTIGHITGFATGTHPTQVAKHSMQTADRDIANQEAMHRHQKEMDYLNYQHSKELFDYQKNLQKELFGREDNAVQRRVADLRAAGINPLLAAGQAAGAGAPVTATAPHHEVTAKPVSMSPKLQALQMKKELYEQQRARSVQLSQMIAHAELLRQQANTERYKQRELDAITGEIKERTPYHSAHTENIKRSTRHYDMLEMDIGSRMHLNAAQIRSLESDIKVDASQIQRNIEAARRDATHREIDSYNYNKAKKLGLRSDISDGLVTQITQLFNFIMEIDEQGSGEVYRNVMDKIRTNIKDILLEIPREIRNSLDWLIDLPSAGFNALRDAGLGFLEGLLNRFRR